MQVDTSTTKRPSRKSAPKPQLGVKRKRKTSEEMSQGSEFEEEHSQEVVSKRRVTKDGKIEERRVTISKKPKEFKLGKWNPDAVMIEVDREKQDKESNLIRDCCIRCNNKNVCRAVLTKNKKLLETCIQSKDQISHLTDFWSSDVPKTPIDYIIEADDVHLLEAFLKPNLKPESKKKFVDYNA